MAFSLSAFLGAATRRASRASSVADHPRCRAAALAVLDGQLEPGDVVLVKASRAVGLERVALALLDPTRLNPADGAGPAESADGTDGAAGADRGPTS